MVDHSRAFPKAILWIEEAELADKTGQEREEESLVMSKPNLTKINSKNQNKLLLQSQNYQREKLHKNNKNLRNPKSWLWLNTIKAKVSTLMLPLLKERFQSRDKLMPNGLKRKSLPLSKPKKTRENKKVWGKMFFNTTTPELRWIWETLKSLVSEKNQLKDQENKNHKDPITTIEDIRARNLSQRQWSRKKISLASDCKYLKFIEMIELFHFWIITWKS